MHRAALAPGPFPSPVFLSRVSSMLAGFPRDPCRRRGGAWVCSAGQRSALTWRTSGPCVLGVRVGPGLPVSLQPAQRGWRSPSVPRVVRHRGHLAVRHGGHLGQRDSSLLCLNQHLDAFDRCVSEVRSCCVGKTPPPPGVHLSVDRLLPHRAVRPGAVQLLVVAFRAPVTVPGSAMPAACR